MLLDINDARLAYAVEVCAAAGADAPSIVKALRDVPREASLGSGPWTLLAEPLKPIVTCDSDPRRVLHNLAVELPSGRFQPAPASTVLLLDRLALLSGERVLSIGHDIAYAAALVAHLTQRSVCARELAADAIAQPVVTLDNAVDELDALLILSGCSRPPWPWLNRLRRGGRAVFPLLGMEGAALYWLVVRAIDGARWSATPLCLGRTLPWQESWDACEAALADALSLRLLEVKSMLPTPDDGEDMVLVSNHGCFSLRA